MTSRDFPQANITIAKDQKEYNPLRAHRGPDGVVTSCWEPNEFELELIKESIRDGKPPHFFVSQLTFGKPLQPLCVQMGFDPPRLEPAPEATPALPPVGMEHTPNIAPEDAKLKLQEVAHCKGMSGPMLFGMDTKSKPGVAICHFLRVETQHLTNTKDFDATQFATLHPDNDPRLLHLAECFTLEPEKAKTNLLKVLILANECLSQVQHQAVMQGGTSRFVDDTRKLVVTALKTYGGA